jgi:glycine betaine catabolism B
MAKKNKNKYNKRMKIKLLRRETVAKDTVSFFFEPQEPTTRAPGQYYYIDVPELKYPDPRGPKRQFTIASSPTEGPIMMVTVRTRAENISGYKKTLYELPDGSIIDAEGPNGHYVLDENTPPSQHVFLAGGIGITPYRCFMKYAIDKGLTTPMHLIYANSTPDEITFRAELEQWAKDHPNIKIDMTISHPEETPQIPWAGLTGRVDFPLIQKLVPNWQDPTVTFWICGPPPMVDALDEAMGKAGIPSQRRKIEKFTGY